MEMGYYKFYRGKKVLLASLLFSILITIRMINSMFWSGIIIVILCLLFFILLRRFFIEITPNYIKMYNFEKLYWKDIEKIELVHSPQTMYNFWPKDIKKYRLTLWQKIAQKMHYAPFYVSPIPFSEQDWIKFGEILKERVPNNNIKV